MITSMRRPTAPASGIVISHASTMSPATPHRTAESPRDAPGAHDRPRDRVGRRHREAVVRGAPEDRGAGRLRRKPLRRVDLRDALSERLDDAPAACVRACRHRERGGCDHPGRRPTKFGSRCPEATSASAITPIVFCASFVPWVKRDEAARDELEPPKEPVHPSRRALPKQPESTTISANASAEAEERRHERRLEHLVRGGRATGRRSSPSERRRSDHAADQRVAGARAAAPGTT